LEVLPALHKVEFVMQVIDLGQMSWTEAWTLQQRAHAEVLRGGDERIFVVEHPHVITLGRQADLSLKNLRYSPEELKSQEIDVVETDRGGNVTYHGPGQLVAYPIVQLSRHRLTVGSYVRLLQDAVIDALSRCMVKGFVDSSAVGVWVDVRGVASKICAVGVRVRRGATLHGLALNVSTDLRYFDLIVPCGLEGRPVTSIARVAGHNTPQMSHVKWLLGNALVNRLLAGDAIELEE
jgi:lipoyl(octanoyl) transferase